MIYAVYLQIVQKNTCVCGEGERERERERERRNCKVATFFQKSKVEDIQVVTVLVSQPFSGARLLGFKSPLSHLLAV